MVYRSQPVRLRLSGFALLDAGLQNLFSRWRCLLRCVMPARLAAHVDLVASLHDDEQGSRGEGDESYCYFPHGLSPVPLKNNAGYGRRWS
jgi:hypothetical protein